MQVRLWVLPAVIAGTASVHTIGLQSVTACHWVAVGYCKLQNFCILLGCIAFCYCILLGCSGLLHTSKLLHTIGMQYADQTLGVIASALLVHPLLLLSPLHQAHTASHCTKATQILKQQQLAVNSSQSRQQHIQLSCCTLLLVKQYTAVGTFHATSHGSL